MHILAALVGIIGAVGVFLWRLNSAAEAAKGLAESADGIRGQLRRRQWAKKAEADPLKLVDDPRVAAAAMLIALAQSDGAITEAEQNAILTGIAESFDIDAKLAAELFAHARWTVRDVLDLDTCFRKLAPIILKTCGTREIEQLLDMANAVARAGGTPGDVERLAIERLQRTLRRQN